MKERQYQKNLMFMGILSTRGFPDSIREKLVDSFGPISYISPSMPFTFTDYYNPEMGEGIERFFISFSRLISPDALADAKTITNAIELDEAVDGKRKINLDPGLISEASVILATTKNRAHRIAIGHNLYAEVTLIYQNHGFVSFPWTYADYRSDDVQTILIKMRKDYLALRR